MLITDLQQGQLVSIPRCYLYGVSGEVKSYELCGFCDASTSAYAAVVYLVMRTDAGSFVKLYLRHKLPQFNTKATIVVHFASSPNDIECHSLASQRTLNPPRCFTDSKVTCQVMDSKRKFRLVDHTCCLLKI